MLQIHRLIILLVLSSFSSLVSALPEDSKMPLLITSDTSTYNYKTGVRTFVGHVKADQGTSHLLADKLITKNNQQNKISAAIAYGYESPAHYWTLPTRDGKEVHAYATIIKLFPLTSTVTLEQNVTITQGENSFHGELIHLNRNEETIIVPATQKGRALLVYNPDK